MTDVPTNTRFRFEVDAGDRSRAHVNAVLVEHPGLVAGVRRGGARALPPQPLASLGRRRTRRRTPGPAHGRHLRFEKRSCRRLLGGVNGERDGARTGRAHRGATGDPRGSIPVPVAVLGVGSPDADRSIPAASGFPVSLVIPPAGADAREAAVLHGTLGAGRDPGRRGATAGRAVGSVRGLVVATAGVLFWRDPSGQPPVTTARPWAAIPRGWNRGRTRRVLTDTLMTTGAFRSIRGIVALTSGSVPAASSGSSSAVGGANSDSGSAPPRSSRSRGPRAGPRPLPCWPGRAAPPPREAPGPRRSLLCRIRPPCLRPDARRLAGTVARSVRLTESCPWTKHT